MIQHAMRRRHVIRVTAFSIFLLTLLLASTPPSSARSASAVEAVFVFGDSISDTGNGCLLPFVLEQLRPGLVDIPEDLLDECRDARYYLGRTTNAPIWAEVFASNLLGTPLFGSPLHELATVPIPVAFFPDEMLVSSAPPALLAFLPDELGISPSLFAGGANLAVAGAETEDLLGPDQDLDPLASEVGAFLALASASKLQSGPEDLYVVWIGGNDVRRQIRDTGSVQIDVGVERIVDTIQTLHDRIGAQRFLVPNLPDVGLSLDFTDEESELATRATKQWNEALEIALEWVVGPDVTPLDAFCLTNAFIRLGKLNTESACLDDTTYPACQGLLLFDDIHATAPIHRGFGVGALAAIECGNGTTGSMHFRNCVSEFTHARVRDGLITRKESRAIKHCIGNRPPSSIAAAQ